MAYLYKTTIYKADPPLEAPDIDNEAEISQNSVDRADFEANFKATAFPVDSLIVASTTFEIFKTYNAFKTLIDGTIIIWGNVNNLETDLSYQLFIFTENPI